MLIALLIATLLSDGNLFFFSDGEIDRVTRTIAEEERAERITASMQRANEELIRLTSARSAVLREATGVSLDPNAGRPEFEASLDALTDARDQAIEVYVEEVFEMRAAMTRAEWNQAFGENDEDD